MANGDHPKSGKHPWRNADRRKLEIAAIAEEMFATRGYDGVSIRDIATAAGVNSALIGYHFGTKERFYRSLFDRRYSEIQKERMAALGAAVIEPGSATSLDAVVAAWLLPLMNLLSDPADKFFVTMLARESSLASLDAHGIYATLLNPAASICKDVFRRIAPDATPHDIAYGYAWMVGVASSTLLGAVGNVPIGGKQAATDPDIVIKPMLNFVSAGLRAHLLVGHAQS